MIQSFVQIQRVLDYLGDLKESGQYTNLQYKVIKNLTNKSVLCIYEDSATLRLNADDLKTKEIDISAFEIRYIPKSEYDDDRDYYVTFFNENKPFEGVTRRLSNAFGAFDAKKVEGVAPVVSFYSYKGGMGRTTTLGALASYFARKEDAKVFILDCDFEAPGLMNLFGMREDVWNNTQGLVEYLVDTSELNAMQQKEVLLKNYVVTISTSAAKDTVGYAGEKGTIYVMNAGNLSTGLVESETAPNGLQTHLDHYLQGLSRIGFENSESICLQFERLLQNIHAQYAPDLILLDSRTGFNDIFNNIALRISDIVIGLFGISQQHKPGLYNFLDEVNVAQKEIFLLNTIAADVIESHEVFLKLVNEYKSDRENDLLLPIWSIEFIARMQKMGTPLDKTGDVLLHYTDSTDYRFPDYQHNGRKKLLEILSGRINDLRKKKTDDRLDNRNTTNPADPQNETLEPVKVSDILTLLSKHYPVIPVNADDNKVETHAENIQITDGYIEKYFYFRNYMRDFFQRDIFIIRGYKGTGKTFLYEALRNKSFTDKLKSFSGIDDKTNYHFINMVDIKSYINFNDLGFETKNADMNRRFWLIFIWNKLMQEFKDDYQTTLSTFSISYESTTIGHFKTYLEQGKYIFEIENDLKKLNDILKAKKITVLISFDYLDKMVNAGEWSKKDNPMSSLVKWVQQNTYSNIYPKLFFRTDLYKKIGSINNSIAAERNVLSLDWTTDEIFGYFFQTVYAVAGNKFINWLYKNHDHKGTGKQKIAEIKDAFDKNNGRLGEKDKDKIAFLVDCFFGKYVDSENPNLGQSYTWFYENLKSANDLISLRPFIFLMQKALNDALLEINISNDTNILSGTHFASNAAREYAGEQHYIDVVSEIDQKLFIDFANTIRNKNPLLNDFRQMSLSEGKLRELILRIFDLQGKPRPQSDEWRNLVEKLIDAGIISQNLSYNNSYSFAFLYKFYLQLEGNPQRKK